MHIPPPGTRVLVRWSDGRMYPATVSAYAQGLLQVHWDAGGAPAWVPPTIVGPLHVVAPQPVVPPVVPQPVASQPGVPQQVTSQLAAAGSIPAPGWQAHAGTTPPGPVKEVLKASPGEPPRRMHGDVQGLPRGLVYKPTGRGPGDGQCFFVFFGFVTVTDTDMAMRMTDIDHLGDDVAALRAAGFRVVVDLHGDLASLDQALAGTHPDADGLSVTGIFWGGHGHEGGEMEAYDGTRFAPEQLTPEAARKATCKLFVMSACLVGQHQARWQTALGPQAQVIGWGAPITNERAIDFLTPDEGSSKDFDDLLLRYLGVRGVVPDGPLVEVRELARRHEDKTAALNMAFDELVDAVAARTRCNLHRGKNREVYFTVPTPPSKDHPDKPRSQVVRVAPVGFADTFVVVGSMVGPYSDALDLARALRVVTPALHVRLAIAKVTPPGQECVLVETLFRRRRLDPITLSRNIVAIGCCADQIEDLFFGSDA